MSTPAEQPSGDPEKGLRIAGLVISAAALGVLVWVSLGRPPLRLAFLRGIMALAQGSARALGQVGISAEDAYRSALDKDTLA